MPQRNPVIQRPWFWNTIQALAITCVGIFVYLPTLHGDWLWDDSAEITANTLLRNWQGLSKIWFSTATLDYFPLKSTVQWLMWQWAGNSPTVYHALNISTHIISAILIWRILLLLGVRHGWLGGLIFVIHPLNQESVGWISELKNTLSLTFLLLCFREIIIFDLASFKQRSKYLMALVLFAAAMLCKSSVAMFPLVLLLFFWYRRGKLTYKDVKLSIPFFVVSFVLGVVTIWFQINRAISGMILPHVSLYSKFLHALQIVFFYISKSIVSVNLCPMYPRLEDTNFIFSNYLPGIIFILVLIGYSLRFRSYNRAVCLALGSFVLNCIPVMGFIPMSYSKISEVADHFAYLPNVSVICIATAGLSLIYEAAGAYRIIQKLGALALTLVLFLWISSAHSRAKIFENAENYWIYTLDLNPKAWGADYNLGWYYTSKPQHLADAIYCYKEAIKIKPEFFEAEENLAGILALNSDAFDESEIHFRKAIAMKPNNAEVYNNYGTLLMNRPSRLNEAVKQFEIAIKLNPRYAEAHDNLAIAFSSFNNGAEQALRESEIAAKLDPTNPKIQGNYANMLARVPGRIDDALIQYQLALNLKPDLAQTHFNYANKLMSIPGRFDEGVSQYLAAINLKPDFAEAHNNLALNLASVPGRKDDAIKHFEEAIRLRPNYAEAHFNYAEFLVTISGRTRDAITHYLIAVELRPDHYELYYKIAILYANIGRYSEALDALTELRKSDPQSSEANALYQKITDLINTR